MSDDANHVSILVEIPITRPTCREQVLVEEGNRFHFARCGATAKWQFSGSSHPAYCLKHKVKHVWRLMYAIAHDSGIPRREAFTIAQEHFSEVLAHVGTHTE